MLFAFILLAAWIEAVDIASRTPDTPPPPPAAAVASPDTAASAARPPAEPVVRDLP